VAYRHRWNRNFLFIKHPDRPQDITDGVDRLCHLEVCFLKNASQYPPCKDNSSQPNIGLTIPARIIAKKASPSTYDGQGTQVLANLNFIGVEMKWLNKSPGTAGTQSG
jgi:hypothetical protein